MVDFNSKEGVDKFVSEKLSDILKRYETGQ